MATKRRGGLGRGIGALIPSSSGSAAQERPVDVFFNPKRASTNVNEATVDDEVGAADPTSNSKTTVVSSAAKSTTKASAKSAKKPVGTTPDTVNEPTADSGNGTSNGRTVGKDAGEADTQAIAGEGGTPTGPTAGKSTGKSSGKAAGRTVGRTSGKATTAATGGDAEDVSAQSARKPTGRTAGNATRKSAATGSGKTAGRPLAESAVPGTDKKETVTASRRRPAKTVSGADESRIPVVPTANNPTASVNRDANTGATVEAATSTAAKNDATAKTQTTAENDATAVVETNTASSPSATTSTDADDDFGLLPVGARFELLDPKRIAPNLRQPRYEFDQEALDELTHSVREFGVLQPIVVREMPADHPNATRADYELIMGERRLRASMAAGLTSIPAIIKETPDDDMLRDALLENLHRAELNPLEEASAYQQLLEDFGITQEQLAQRIGRSRSQISNTIRLMRLPLEVQRRVAAGVLSAGHARAILSVADPAAMTQLAEKIVTEDLSVREAEQVAAEKAPRRLRTERPSSTAASSVSAYLDEVSTRLGDHLNTRAKVTLRKTKGQIVIDFATIDDLNRMLNELGVERPE